MRLNSSLIIAVLVSCIFLFSQSAFAWLYDGNLLVKYMQQFEMAERRDDNAIYGSAGTYRGYVAGVFDSTASTLCHPDLNEQISIRQVCWIVAKYLKEHPEDWGKPAFVLVRSALRKAFPCK